MIDGILPMTVSSDTRVILYLSELSGILRINVGGMVLMTSFKDFFFYLLLETKCPGTRLRAFQGYLYGGFWLSLFFHGLKNQFLVKRRTTYSGRVNKAIASTRHPRRI